MSESDKDGKIAEMVGDMFACLSMELNENVRQMQQFSDQLSSGDRCFMCGHGLPARRWWQPRLRRCSDYLSCHGRFILKFDGGKWFA